MQDTFLKDSPKPSQWLTGLLPHALGPRSPENCWWWLVHDCESFITSHDTGVSSSAQALEISNVLLTPIQDQPSLWKYVVIGFQGQANASLFPLRKVRTSFIYFLLHIKPEDAMSMAEQVNCEALVSIKNIKFSWKFFFPPFFLSLECLSFLYWFIRALHVRKTSSIVICAANTNSFLP